MSTTGTTEATNPGSFNMFKRLGTIELSHYGCWSGGWWFVNEQQQQSLKRCKFTSLLKGIRCWETINWCEIIWWYGFVVGAIKANQEDDCSEIARWLFNLLFGYIRFSYNFLNNLWKCVGKKQNHQIPFTRIQSFWTNPPLRVRLCPPHYKLVIET